MKKIYLVIASFILPAMAFSQACSDLFISEYIEGSGYNKAIEIYNPTSGTVELSGYKLMTFFNGVDTTAPNNQMFLSGQLASGDVFIVCNGQADSTVKAIADVTNSFVANWNGNDAVVLLNTISGDTLDIIGEVGVNPGQTGWPADTGTTTNHTIIRNASTQEGYTNWSLSSATWIAYGINNFSHLGSHTMNSCAAVNPSLYFVVDTVNVLESTLNFSVKVGITNPNNSATSVDVKISGGTATESVDYTFTNPTNITFPANSSTPIAVSGTIINDLISEPDETIELSLSNQTNEASITSGPVTITIYDNDGLGVNSISDNSVSVYPKITDGIFYVSSSSNSNVSVYDVFGNEVYHSKNNSNSIQIDLSDNSSGIYLVEVKNENSTSLFKLLVK